jgi:transcriptional regulator with XRE-family HTH domain
MSQSQLSKISGLPKSTINHIEGGASSPSVDSVEALASALGVSLEELLSAPTAAVDIRDESQMPILKDRPRGGKVVRLLPDPFPGLDLYIVEIEAGGLLSGTVQSPRGRKFAYCLSGAIQLQVAGNSYTIKRGSTVVFPGDESHSFRNQGTTKAQLFSIHFYAEPETRSHLLAEPS